MKRFCVSWEEDFFDLFGEKNDCEVIVSATDRDEAIEQFLLHEFDFYPNWVLAEQCMLYFSDMAQRDDFREIFIDFDCGIEKIIKWKKILDVQNNHDDKTMEKFWLEFEKSDQKRLFVQANMDQVFAFEVREMDEYYDQKRRKLNDVIVDQKEEDILLLNLCLECIRKEKKDYYSISSKHTIKDDIDENRTKELLRYFFMREREFCLQIHWESGFSYFTCFLRKEFKILGEDEVIVSFKPAPILYDLASTNYDFRNGKDEIAEKILMNAS